MREQQRACALWPRAPIPADLRLPRVQSINASGHKYGLVYPGVGWAICYQNPNNGLLSNHWITLHETGNVAGFEAMVAEGPGGTDSLWTAHNIRVNCICPGPMYTPMVYAHGNGMSEAARAQRANASLLKTEGTGWDVGHAVKFLLSDHARYITGQVLVVDGGVTLQGPERNSRDH